MISLLMISICQWKQLQDPPKAVGNVTATAEADDEKVTFASAHGLSNGDAVRVIQSSAPAISGTAQYSFKSSNWSDLLFQRYIPN